MGRPRSKERTGWPKNLYKREKGGRTYYKYRLPSGKFKSVGRDLETARAVAEQLNSKRVTETVRTILERVLKKEIVTIPDHTEYVIAKLREKRHQDKSPMSEKTIYEYKRTYTNLDKFFPGADVAIIPRRDLTRFLEQFPPAARARHKINLVRYFGYAISRGLRDDDPTRHLEDIDVVVTRERLNMEAFEMIRDKAPEWFKTAMDLAFYTAQSPVDVTNMRWSDIEEGVLRVVRQKVRRHENGGFIAIHIGPKLRAVLGRCRKLEPVDSPYILKRPYARKVHGWEQGLVTVSYLSDTFAQIRDQKNVFDGHDNGLFSELPIKDRPSFGEIRSLKAKQIRVTKTLEDARKMLGHATTQQTERYLKGHGANWEVAESD